MAARNAPYWRWLALAVLGVLALPLYARILAVAGLLATQADRFTLPELGALVVAVGAAALVLASRPAATRRVRWIELALLLGFGVAFRAVFFAATPAISHDAYRYVWDAHLLANGVSPWTHTLSDPTLAPLRDSVIWPQVNWRSSPTIYPPGAQLFFLLVNAIAPLNIAAMKWAMTLCDFGVGALTLVLLRQHGQDLRRVVLYWWNPLPIVEFTFNAHVDAVATLWTLAALVVLARDTQHVRDTRRARLIAGVLLALAAATKLYPLLFAVALLRPTSSARTPRKAPVGPQRQRGRRRAQQAAPLQIARAGETPAVHETRAQQAAPLHPQYPPLQGEVHQGRERPTLVAMASRWPVFAYVVGASGGRPFALASRLRLPLSPWERGQGVRFIRSLITDPLLLALGAGFILIYLPFTFIGLGNGGFLATYFGQRFVDQGILFRLITTVFVFIPIQLALQGSALVGLCGLVAWLRLRRRLDMTAGVLAISAIWIVLSPHLLPWYVAGLLPLLALHLRLPLRSKDEVYSLALYLFALAMPFTYVIFAPSHGPNLFVWFFYVPLAIAALPWLARAAASMRMLSAPPFHAPTFMDRWKYRRTPAQRGRLERAQQAAPLQAMGCPPLKAKVHQGRDAPLHQTPDTATHLTSLQE